MNELESKRKEVLEAIKPICDVFGIKDYDYIIKKTGQRETLRLNDTLICCDCNSISAVVDELIGYIFIKKWCKKRYIPINAINKIREYWIQGEILMKTGDKVKSLIDGKIYTVEKADNLNKILRLEELSGTWNFIDFEKVQR